MNFAQGRHRSSPAMGTRTSGTKSRRPPGWDIISAGPVVRDYLLSCARGRVNRGHDSAFEVNDKLHSSECALLGLYFEARS